MPHLVFNYVRQVGTKTHANLFKMSTTINRSRIEDRPPTIHPIATPLVRTTGHHHLNTLRVQLHHLLSAPLGGHQPTTLPLIGIKSRCRRSLYHHPLATQMAESAPRVAHLHCLMRDHENISRATAIMRHPPPLNGMVLLWLLMLNNSPPPSSQLHSNHFSGSMIRCRLGVQKLTTTSMISADLSSSPVASSLQRSVPKMLCPIRKHRSSGAVRYGRVPARK